MSVPQPRGTRWARRGRGWARGGRGEAGAGEGGRDYTVARVSAVRRKPCGWASPARGQALHPLPRPRFLQASVGGAAWGGASARRRFDSAAVGDKLRVGG